MVNSKNKRNRGKRKKMIKSRNAKDKDIQKSITATLLVTTVTIVSILAVLAPMTVAADASTVSFLHEDSFAGVDLPIGWSINDNMVNLGTDNWSLLNGTLTHRGTRGLGVFGMEDDEVDSIDKLERLEITFDTPHCLSYLEVRSLFDNEGPGGETEEGDIDLYLAGSPVSSYHPVGVEDSGNGSWNTSVPDILVDKIVFYVNNTQSYAGYSEFAVAKVDVEPFEINVNKSVWKALSKNLVIF